MELVALQSFLDAEVLGVSGYPVPPRARRFQRLDGLPATSAPVPFDKTGFILS
jgi:hypothetical protein